MNKSTENRQLMINGELVHDRILRRLPELTKAVIASILEQVSFYRQLPDEEIAGDIVRVIQENLRMFAGLMRDRRLPDAAELSGFGESAMRRAEEGVPLEMVLDAYHVAAHHAWQVITADARPEDADDLRATTDLVIGYLRAVLVAVTGAYIEELRSMNSQEQSARHTLISALLAGEPADEAASRAGVTLPAGFLVLALRVGEHPDERAAGVGSAIAARRKLRRMQAELARFSDEPALSLMDSHGGMVLIPSAQDVDGNWTQLAGLTDRMADAAGTEVTVAVSYAEPSVVANAATQVREVLDVVLSTGRPAGLYRIADVLLDYQLSRPTPASAALAALLEPVAHNEELLSTLRLHLDNELNRKRTARMLHIHPNTVDYRLRRITALTGLNPAVPSHVPLLTAALAARKALRSATQPTAAATAAP